MLRYSKLLYYYDTRLSLISNAHLMIIYSSAFALDSRGGVRCGYALPWYFTVTVRADVGTANIQSRVL